MAIKLHIDKNDLNKQIDMLTKFNKRGLNSEEEDYYDGLINLLCTLTEIENGIHEIRIS